MLKTCKRLNKQYPITGYALINRTTSLLPNRLNGTLPRIMVQLPVFKSN